MKVSKTNPVHWLYLTLFSLWVTCAIFARPFRSRAKPYKVVLYGHTLSGNLLAIYRYVEREKAGDITVTYLCLDPHEYRRVLAEGGEVMLATRPACARLLIRADAIITDHGLHSMKPLLFFSDLKFFDVWHGIPFKGFDENDFRVQHRYDEVWVASPLLAEIYTKQYGFDPTRIQVTGYARTDILVNPTQEGAAIKRKIGVSSGKDDKLVLFAPTWQQDSINRSILPFDLDQATFLNILEDLSQRIGATIAIRTHLNSTPELLDKRRYNRIVNLPAIDFPNTEDLLLATDLLVCDWSSIAFDFLLLNRPTIFLDVEAPFKKGLTLTGWYRFGPVAHCADEMTQMIEQYFNSPEFYTHHFQSHAEHVRRLIYEGYADGNATCRCVQRLRELLFISD